MRPPPPAPLLRLHEKLRVYRSIFEIRYLIKVRKLLLELLIKRGIPPEIVRYSIWPLISPCLPNFDRFRCYHYNYTSPSIVVTLKPSVYIHINCPTSADFQANLHLSKDNEASSIVVSLTQNPDVRILDQVIHYCYCLYQLGDTSLIERPHCLLATTLPTL